LLQKIPSGTQFRRFCAWPWWSDLELRSHLNLFRISIFHSSSYSILCNCGNCMALFLVLKWRPFHKLSIPMKNKSHSWWNSDPKSERQKKLALRVRAQTGIFLPRINYYPFLMKGEKLNLSNSCWAKWGVQSRGIWAYLAQNVFQKSKICSHYTFRTSKSIYIWIFCLQLALEKSLPDYYTCRDYIPINISAFCYHCLSFHQIVEMAL
jgi:hypothetical protein